MKEVAILLLLTVMLSGCGTKNPVQAGVGGIWQAVLVGGEGQASGLSFNTQFTVSGSTLSFSTLQFLNNDPGACFPLSPALSGDSGTADLQYNSADQLTNSTVTITVTSGSNTLTQTSQTVTGTINTNTNVLSDGVVTGTWVLAGGTGCTGTGGSFTMTQSASNI